MGFDLAMDVPNNLARLVLHGEVGKPQIKKAARELIMHDAWQPGMDVLCDCRRIGVLSLGMDVVRELTEEEHAYDEEIGPGRWAVVTASDYVFGTARGWEIMSEPMQRSLVVFRDMAMARAWLQVDTEVPNGDSKAGRVVDPGTQSEAAEARA